MLEWGRKAREKEQKTNSNRPKHNKKVLEQMSETISLRQYSEKASGAELLICAEEAGVKPKLRNRILCFKTEKKDQEVFGRTLCP